MNPPDSARIAVRGHDGALAALTGALASGRAPQACLLVGPPSVGRSTLARRLAQWVMCTATDDLRPCGACRACRLVAEGVHPDLLLFDSPLKVEAVRELQHRLALAPLEGAHHVAVLRDIDRASAGAANSLLKTLEEPPADALLLLTASDLAGVLPTVRSRCQSVALRPMTVEAATVALASELQLDADMADLLARLSGGRLGWAFRAAREPAFLESRDLWLDRMEEALDAGSAARLQCADAWSRQRDAFAEGLQIWLGWWRDVLLLQHRLEPRVVNIDRLTALRRAAQCYPRAATVRVLATLQASAERLRGGASADLLAAVFLMELPA